MIKVSLIPAGPCHFRAMRALYEASFPPEERRPWQSIEMPASDFGPLLNVISLSDGALVGFVTVWLFDKFIYVEHLAVDPAVRGCGIGAAALAAIKNKYALPLALEVEPPSDGNPIAARRIEFYKRNGFDVLDFNYIQPPYAENLPSVPLLLMATSGAPKPALIVEKLYREVYGVSV